MSVIGNALTLGGGGSSNPSKMAHGEFSGVNASLTIQHNLNSTKLIAFWRVKDNASLHAYTQIIGVWMTKEVWVGSGWKYSDTGVEMDLTSKFAANIALGWQSVNGNNNVTLYSTQFAYGAYNELAANDGNTLTIPFNARICDRWSTYEWWVVDLS